MEDNLKILNVEYLSNNCTVRDFGFLWGKLEENSEEISSVALLSPTCLCFQINVFNQFIQFLFLTNCTFSADQLCNPKYRNMDNT